MSVRIRAEAPDDVEAIHGVIAAAFEGAAHSDHYEPFIVSALRRSAQLSISLVAERDGTVIGHVAISRVTISDGTAGWYGLGPISVVPEHQGKGVGSRLMERALVDLRTLGASGCAVLGDPAYYGRFGFQVERVLTFPGVPPEYFQVLSFDGRLPMGTVGYHESFAAKG